MGVSLLTTLGVPELIVDTREAYVHTAVRLALSPDELLRLRHRVQEQRDVSPLFDPRQWVRGWESALRLTVDLRLSHGHTEHHVIPRQPRRAA